MDRGLQEAHKSSSVSDCLLVSVASVLISAIHGSWQGLSRPLLSFSLFHVNTSLLFLYLFWASLTPVGRLFPSLKELSLTLCSDKFGNDLLGEFYLDEEDGVELPLESLSLSGIGAGDRSMGWCLQDLLELELRACWSIADGVLLQLAEHCEFLNSLLLSDGGSWEGKGLKNLGTAMSIKLEELALSSCDVSVDISRCWGIGAETVEFLVMNSPRLRQVGVEESKLLAIAKTFASAHFLPRSLGLNVSASVAVLFSL
ncbi:hypothetical protein HHK36_029576 [Tetracentron sinense]|uniref:Uncharacterized protein n=1 Tax=Tetracentron sinense TaxID=13715 RepID=A0A835CZR5_TETSI|nr:hypothetical protein HHK36_029576 [Tetracentron sinense]